MVYRIAMAASLAEKREYNPLYILIHPDRKKTLITRTEIMILL
jgi:hypothetical protein